MEKVKRSQNLVWIDMEMSGLNPQKDVVLEIATIITTESLEIVAEGPNLVISRPESLFNKMDNWNQTHHKESGLWQSVLDSKISEAEAEFQTLQFIKEYCEDQSSPLCGNSIAQDKMFLLRYMPSIASYLHYRLIDVSTLKELTKRWYPNGPKAESKKGNHRALDDIKESIEELRFYRKNYFIL